MNDYGETREQKLQTVKNEIERLNLGPIPSQDKYKKLRGEPSIPWIRKHLQLSWRELLIELGYETRPEVKANTKIWDAMSDQDLSSHIMNFMANNNVISRTDFVKKTKASEVPSQEYIVKRFGKNGVSILLERTYEHYGVPSNVKRRMWVYLTKNELLDHAHYEIEDQGLNTVLAYIQQYDRRIAPSLQVLRNTFGGQAQLYDAYRKRFGKEMFITSYAKRNN